MSPFLLLLKYKKKRSTLYNRGTFDYLHRQTPFPLLAAIVWVTGKWKKENVPAFGVLANRERSPCVTTALFGIWGVSLFREADN